MRRGSWLRFDHQGVVHGPFDWLVVTSSLMGTNLWRDIHGGVPPLLAAADRLLELAEHERAERADGETQLSDAEVEATFSSLSALESETSIILVMAFEGEAASHWAKLPCTKCELDLEEDGGVLERLVLFRIHKQLTGVVLHSTHAFAEKHRKASGEGKTMHWATADERDEDEDEATDPRRVEQMIAQKMLAGLVKYHHRDGMPLLETPSWGPYLHRWGGAYPTSCLQPTETILVSNQLAIAGDFVAGPRFGSVEGAVLSGSDAADAVAAQAFHFDTHSSHMSHTPFPHTSESHSSLPRSSDSRGGRSGLMERSLDGDGGGAPRRWPRRWRKATSERSPPSTRGAHSTPPPSRAVGEPRAIGPPRPRHRLTPGINGSSHGMNVSRGGGRQLPSRKASRDASAHSPSTSQADSSTSCDGFTRGRRRRPSRGRPRRRQAVSGCGRLRTAASCSCLSFQSSHRCSSAPTATCVHRRYSPTCNGSSRDARRPPGEMPGGMRQSGRRRSSRERASVLGARYSRWCPSWYARAPGAASGASLSHGSRWVVRDGE